MYNFQIRAPRLHTGAPELNTGKNWQKPREANSTLLSYSVQSQYTADHSFLFNRVYNKLTSYVLCHLFKSCYN